MKKTLYFVFASLLLSACQEKSPEIFEGAEWIGTDDVVLNASYLAEYSLTFDVSLSDNTPTATLLFGGNDSRLMTKDLNHMGIASKKDDIYMSMCLNQKGISLKRKGFEKDGKEHTIQEISLPATFTSAPMHIKAEVELGKMILAVNDSVLGTFKINPNDKTGGDYIPYPVLGEIGARGDADIERLEVRNLRSPYTLYYQTDKLAAGTDLFDPSQLGMPVLKSAIEIADKPIECANLYATARGVYEVYLNGEKVGDDYFAPGCSQYNKTHYYQTYDVKEMLSAGKNEVQTLLGEGWWMGSIGFWSRGVNHFGDQLAFRAQLVIRYEDGELQVLNTNAADWQVATDGEIRYSSRFNGEIIDAGMKPSAWKPAQIMDLEGHLPSESAQNMPAVNEYSSYQLLPQPDQGVKQRDLLTAIGVEEVRPGVFVYDMGQNMAGLPLISFTNLQKGQQIRMRYAEVKYPDMKEYQLNKGMVMMENIRAAFAQDLYYASGEATETFAPHFTLHGYRFVEITGISEALPLEAVKGRVLSSIELVSDFTCSNELVNRLWKNIQWSTLGNFISIPTDCPQRNERLGWGGDINVYSRTSTYIADNYDFLRRHMRNITDLQDEEGHFPDIAPVNGGFGGFLWGSAGIAIPYEAWKQTGREEIVTENFEPMNRYMEYVKTHYIEEGTNLLVQERSWGGLGDWLNLEYNKLDRSSLFECYYIFELNCMAEMARAIGKEAEAQAYAERAAERKKFFVSTYLDPTTGKALYSNGVPEREGEICDYEASYVLPLAFGIIDDAELRAKVTDNLVASIERENYTDAGVKCPTYSLMTGFVTTAWICKALSDNGRSDVAYRLLQNRTYPSWLYPVSQGATTIWERLNSYNDFEGFGGNNSMNSFNHYSFGAVGQWMMSRILGIERDKEQAGFTHFILQPMADPTLEMSYASGWYRSENGMIESSWERTNDGVSYRFAIPEGCSATLLLEGEEPQELGEGVHTLSVKTL